MNACCNGWSVPSAFSKPSMVVTVLPRASYAKYVQALTGAPSINTVQAPQTWTSQETLVPLRFSVLRRTSARVSAGSQSTSLALPLSWNESFISNIIGVMEWWNIGALGFLQPVTPSRHYFNDASSVISRQNIFRPELHLPIQTIHRRIDDFDLEVLHAAFDKLIDPPAHIVHRTEDMAVEGELHAVDVALVALAAGLERGHSEIQPFVARLGDSRELLDGDGDLRRIAARVLRGLRQDVAADLHFLGREPARDPAFAVFSGALGGKLHPTADPNRRMRLLEWFRINLGVFKLDEISLIRRQLLRPDRFHRFDIFVGAIAAPFIGYAENAELVRLPRRLGAETHADQ